MTTEAREYLPHANWLPKDARADRPKRSRVVARRRAGPASRRIAANPGWAARRGQDDAGTDGSASVERAFRDGVSFVDLTATRDPALVAQAVAASIGIADASSEDLLETLVRVLLPRNTLLILDDFEQVLPAAATVRQLLERSPQLRILVTSRTPLLLSFEQQCLIPPMSVPDLRGPLVGDEIEQSPAVALFKLRARAVDPEWELTSKDAAVVAEICVRLDGLPLAIELAASWIGILPASAILERLKRMLDLLTSPQQDRSPRHQTLRAAI